MSVALRPYQADIIAQARDLMRAGVRSILIQAPTGSGKTLLTAHMLKTAADKGMHSWFIVHRRELIMQSSRAFAGEGVRHGIIAASYHEDRRQLVQLASVQTLAGRHSRYKPPQLMVWDECHHLASGSWTKIYNAYPRAFHIGLSATPSRLDGRGLGLYFSRIIQGPSVQWLIENKFLSDYKLYAPSTVSTAGIHTRMGDFAKDELSDLMDKPSITGDAVAHYKKYCDGKRAVVFCVSIQHSKHVVEKFKQAGISAAHVDGGTDKGERDAEIKRFINGTTKVLGNVELFGEGFDVPGIESIILLRPTKSLGLYLQQIGRGLRIATGKSVATILDHVGNCQRHGLPDEPREWSLEGRRSGRGAAQGDSASSVSICPSCFAAQFAGNPSCRFCGFLLAKPPRTIEQKEGTLSEVDREAIRNQSRKAQGQTQTLEELTALGIKRGYKHARQWAQYVFQARQAKKLGGVR